MTAEITQLGLSVDSTQVKTASSVLDGMAAAGKRAETAATGLEASARKAGTAAAGLASASRQATAGVSAAATAAKALQGSQKGVAEAMRDTAAGAKASAAQLQALTRAQEESAAASARSEAAQAGLAAATARLASAQQAFARVSAESKSTQEQTAAAAARVQSAQASVAAATLRASTAQTTAAKAADAHKQALGALGKQTALTANQAQQLGFQLNDFFVQVASGGSPLTALIQQGSQLSGTFGGVGGAFQAITSLITPLRVGVLGVVGAIAGIGLAAAATESWQRSLGALRAQLTATGRAGLSDDIAQLIEQLSQAPGVTREAAIGIVSELSKVHEIGAGIFGNLAKLSADFARATGTDAEAAAKTLAKAFADPAQGAKQLEGALGTLSSATLLTVQRLAEQGDKVGAQKVLLDALRQAVGGLADQTTDLQKATNELGNAWNRMTGSMRQSEGLQVANARLAGLLGWVTKLIDRLPDLEERARSAFRGSVWGAMLGIGQKTSEGGATGGWDAPAAAAPGNVSALDEQTKAALKMAEGYKSTAARTQELIDKQVTLKKTLADVVASTDPKFGPQSAQAKALRSAIAGIDEQLDGLRKKNKKSSDNGVTKGLLQADVQGIKDALQQQTTAYTVAESILEATRRAGLVDEREYYEAKRGYINLNTDAQVRALEAENARIAKERATGKDAIDNRKQIAENEARIATLRVKAAGELQVLSIQEQAAFKAVQQGINNARDSLLSYTEELERAQRREVEGLGLGNAERNRLNGRAQVEDKFEQQRRDLLKKRRDTEFNQNGVLTATQSQIFDDELALINQFQQRALSSFDNYYAQRREKEQQFGVGVSEALQNYLEEVRNVSKQAEGLFTNIFHGAEESLTKFLTTGKGGFKEFANSISAEMTRIAVRQTITGPLAEAFKNSTSSGGVLAGIFGAAGGGEAGAAASGVAGAAQSAAATAAQTAQTAAVTANTAAVTALATAETTATAAVVALAGAASAASTALALVAANAAAEAGGDALGVFIKGAGFAAGAADGGTVHPWSLQPVNERGTPELLTVSGRDYLMMGSQGGKVTPMDKGASQGPGIVQNVHFTIQGRIDRSTEDQIAAKAGRAVERAMRRNTA